MTVVTHLFLDIMLKCGFPSDNWTEFKSKLIEHLFQQLDTKRSIFPLITLKLTER